MTVTIEFCGEETSVGRGTSVTIGRDADICIDDNPFLHRHFLVVGEQNGLWLVTNVGSRLSATISDEDGRMEAFLAPDASLPIVFERTRVAFTAGPTSYELFVHNSDFSFRRPRTSGAEVGDTTIGSTRLTTDQLLLIVALAEPRLRGDGKVVTSLPSSSDAARRLGWTVTKFNRKLDNVCQKLTRLGVRGLHGSTSDLATGRRARLVEYAVATRLVQRDHLELLDD